MGIDGMGLFWRSGAFYGSLLGSRFPTSLLYLIIELIWVHLLGVFFYGMWYKDRMGYASLSHYSDVGICIVRMCQYRWYGFRIPYKLINLNLKKNTEFNKNHFFILFIALFPLLTGFIWFFKWDGSGHIPPAFFDTLLEEFYCRFPHLSLLECPCSSAIVAILCSCWFLFKRDVIAT